jgi:hypothetical protein
VVVCGGSGGGDVVVAAVMVLLGIINRANLRRPTALYPTVLNT